MPPVGAGGEPHEYLDGEPGVADALDVEEGLVRARLVLVKRPGPGVVGGLDGDVLDQRDAHVRVSLEAEGHDGHHDEEHRDHPDHLRRKKREII